MSDKAKQMIEASANSSPRDVVRNLMLGEAKFNTSLLRSMTRRGKMQRVEPKNRSKPEEIKRYTEKVFSYLNKAIDEIDRAGRLIHGDSAADSILHDAEYVVDMIKKDIRNI